VPRWREAPAALAPAGAASGAKAGASAPRPMRTAQLKVPPARSAVHRATAATRAE
jgi:hypothetical protein